MKKELSKENNTDEEMLPEYDFSGGVRGKHYKARQNGYTIRIHQADGSIVTQHIKPNKGTVILDPDLREYFPSSESVNETLRALVKLVPQKRKPTSKKARSLSK